MLFLKNWENDKKRILLEHPVLPGNNILDKAGRKTTRRRTQAIAKRYAFHANAEKENLRNVVKTQ